MAKSDTYRTTAAAMRKRATGAGTPEHRAAWAMMATKWEDLAHEVDAAAEAVRDLDTQVEDKAEAGAAKAGAESASKGVR